jgi:phage-related protein
MAADFLWLPDYKAANEDTTPRVLVSKFDDGYEERRADGLNNLPRTFNLTFTRDKTEIDAIVSFLRGKQGYQKFSFVPPPDDPGTGDTINVVCSEPWKRNQVDYNIVTLSVTLREVFEA